MGNAAVNATDVARTNLQPLGNQPAPVAEKKEESKIVKTDGSSVKVEVLKPEFGAEEFATILNGKELSHKTENFYSTALCKGEKSALKVIKAIALLFASVVTLGAPLYFCWIADHYNNAESREKIKDLTNLSDNLGACYFNHADAVAKFKGLEMTQKMIGGNTEFDKGQIERANKKYLTALANLSHSLQSYTKSNPEAVAYFLNQLENSTESLATEHKAMRQDLAAILVPNLTVAAFNAEPAKALEKGAIEATLNTIAKKLSYSGDTAKILPAVAKKISSFESVQKEAQNMQSALVANAAHLLGADGIMSKEVEKELKDVLCKQLIEELDGIRGKLNSALNQFEEMVNEKASLTDSRNELIEKHSISEELAGKSFASYSNEAFNKLADEHKEVANTLINIRELDKKLAAHEKAMNTHQSSMRTLLQSLRNKERVTEKMYKIASSGNDQIKHLNTLLPQDKQVEFGKLSRKQYDDLIANVDLKTTEFDAKLEKRFKELVLNHGFKSQLRIKKELFEDVHNELKHYFSLQGRVERYLNQKMKQFTEAKKISTEYVKDLFNSTSNYVSNIWNDLTANTTETESK